MISDQLRSRIYGGTQKALWEQLWNLPESAKSVLQMVTFRLYMISRESQLSERLTPKRSIPDRRSSDATWQAGVKGLPCLQLAQRRGPGSAGSLQELDEEPTYRWGGRLSEDDP